MSLYGMMRTGVSGMNAQANRLSTVSDNIANSSTTGYKGASTEFSSLLMPQTNGTYNSGSVETETRYSISQQGALTYTTSDTDLAINGEGYFIVQDSSGQSFLTRAGSFTSDSTGNLVNAGGYTLMGYSYGDDAPSVVANGFAGLEAINVSSTDMQANASTDATFSANLDAGEEIIEDTMPGDSGTSASVDDINYTHKSSLTTYDSLGNEVIMDIYFSKTSETEWDVAVFNKADADADSGSFPYTSDALTTQTLTFDPDTGAIVDGGTTTAAIPADTITNMPDVFTFDFAGMTQLGYDFSVTEADVNGNGASVVTGVEIAADGTVSAKYDNGDTSALYQIALGTVTSPDNMDVLSGNVYSPNAESGDLQIGFAGSTAFGDIVSGALEDSNVDLASELTTMIASQRSYTANSKVFQAGSDLLETLVNLAR
ncbi:flagellar hook protein FlgE [Rhizobium sp. SG_E_25_P2]|uniref:flagellar hook protein FlgE n=1 Tax=Rhizobium sp. SG_E_25_P2 TaxID=2879942 RepID=UPI0024760A09|nr:flagellar hook protein FlgE [Rhizobium sp. SG_E_25_P2]MDH6266461.1 flagellar hook protein FlgE [Rhizobium sp. SG_E_25_P2]